MATHAWIRTGKLPLMKARRRARWLIVALATAGTAICVSNAHGSDVSGRVEMPELCSTSVSPAVVLLDPLDPPRKAVDSVPATHFINQRGLMFEPRVIAMRMGETLRFGNADPELHNVHLRGKATNFNRSVAPGDSGRLHPARSRGPPRALRYTRTHASIRCGGGFAVGDNLRSYGPVSVRRRARGPLSRLRLA